MNNINKRILKNGSEIESFDKPVDLIIHTKAPEKWKLVDLETGETEYLIMDENSAVLIPNNKAHGFLTLVPNTIVVYMSKGEYNPDSEHSLLWWKNEEVFNVVSHYSGSNEVVLSEKDANGK